MQTTDFGAKLEVRTETVADVRARLEEAMPVLAQEAPACEELGKLTPKVRDILRQSGVMRIFQPREYDGMEGNPVEYCRLVMDLCAEAPSASAFVAANSLCSV